jgi:hypothetical protein
LCRYDEALADGVVFNALDACKHFGVDASGLDDKWWALCTR